jgi:ABC-type branched-subunit amino acid transport system substrate-binding protein
MNRDITPMHALPKARSSKILTTAVAVLAVLVGTSACGGSGAASSNKSNLSGTPIRIMSIGTFASNPIFSAPEDKTAIEAGVAAINKAGGIKGRPIEATFCDDGFNPTGVTKCANEAVSDKVVAVVGSLSSFPGFLPILEKAGIAYLGSSGMSIGEYDSPVAFPVSGGIPAVETGLGHLANTMGLKRVTFMGNDAPLNADNLANAKVGLAEGGATLVRSLRVALAATEFSSFAAAAIKDGVDGIILTSSPNTAPGVIKALRQAGFNGPVLAPLIQYSVDSIKSLGADGNNVYLVGTVVNPSNTAIPAVEQFRADMDTQDPKALKDELSLSAWSGLRLFESLVKDMSTIDSKSVLQAISELSTPIDVGTVAPYSVKPNKAPSGFPQMYNPTVSVNKVVDGIAVQQGGFVNPYLPAS